MALQAPKFLKWDFQIGKWRQFNLVKSAPFPTGDVFLFLQLKTFNSAPRRIDEPKIRDSGVFVLFKLIFSIYCATPWTNHLHAQIWRTFNGFITDQMQARFGEIDDVRP